MLEAQDARDLVEVYWAGSAPEARLLQLQLESQAIPSVVENETLCSGIGLSLGGAAEACVLVAREDLDAARVIAEEFDRKTPAIVMTEPGLRCFECGHQMGLRDVCESCGWTYGPTVPDDETATFATGRQFDL
jgi:hypothetical protein